MSDEYLWNKQGSDREVEALEELLRPLCHGARIPAHAPRELPKARNRWRPALVVLAAAAVIALVVPWWKPAAEQSSTAAIASTAREIDLKEYGSVQVHEGALVEVVRQTDEDIRLRLERGTIEARISLAARPRLFQVETPATTCVDLGCQYTLTVAADGSTFVHVDLGQVAFVERGRETWIPRGASCRAWPSRGSGTPRWDDARPELVAAIERMDRAAESEQGVAANAVIELCTEKRDALSLWHLTHAGDAAVVEAAWTSLVDLTGAPEGVEDPRAPEAAEHWKDHLQSVW